MMDPSQTIGNGDVEMENVINISLYAAAIFFPFNFKCGAVKITHENVVLTHTYR